mmetsp:Transcript_14352/g.36282  ORF Transcript_14352/g.36282 Transcript_14352/m.36282 type:complete len:344 (+) Transcript_14352:507-1538(+)
MHQRGTVGQHHTASITFLLIIRRSEDHHTTTKEPRPLHGFHHTAALLFRPALLAQLPHVVGALPSPHLTQLGHQVDEHLGWVELARCPHLSSSIVPVECVVPVVPSFTNGRKRHPAILGRHVPWVVGLLTECMDHRVHRPCRIQDACIPEYPCDQEPVPERVPKHRRHIRGHEETQQQIPEGISTLLKHHHGICFQISHAQALPSCDHLRSLLRQHPPSVGEEESTSSIMRIRRRVRIQMMNTMIPGPVVDCSLACHRIAQHQEHSQRQRRLVRLVRPKTVDASCDPQRRYHICDSDKRPRTPLQLLMPSPERAHSTKYQCDQQSVARKNMDNANIDCHRPIH